MASTRGEGIRTRSRPGDERERFRPDDTRVADVMSRDVVKVPPLAESGQASDLASSSRVEHLVVAEGSKLYGVLCTCDLSRSTRAPVASIMSAPPVTVRDDATVRQAAALITATGVGCLPVLDAEDQLVGVLTRGDLARLGLLDLSEQTCASCGSHHHVKHLAGYDNAFCTLCLDSTPPAVSYDELGWGD
jgi:CBS domain-containing protein